MGEPVPVIERDRAVAEDGTEVERPVPVPLRPARPAWKRLLQMTLGVLCLVVGVIGGFVPILQGWMFIGLGLVILAPVFPPARRLMIWCFRRWPKLRRAVPRKYRRGDPFIRDDLEFPEDPDGTGCDDEERPAT